MHINFFAGVHPIEFIRDPITGRAEARSPGGSLLLQDPLDPGTHFSLALTREWRFSIEGVEIRVQKRRPILLAGLRPSRYRVFVNDKLVTEQIGV